MQNEKFLLVGVLFVIFTNSIVSGQWRKADLTTFESYPTTQKECVDYNGCAYQGKFAFVSGTKSRDWVKNNNIIAIHSKDSKKYKLKTLRLRKGPGGKTIDAIVYDECSDKDCKGCCTKNIKKTGFLIDIESYTAKKLGSSSGIVEWMCVDCK